MYKHVGVPRVTGERSARFLIIWACAAWSFVSVGACAGETGSRDYAERPEVAAFVDEMVKRHGLDREVLESAFERVERKPAILEAIARPAERTLSWAEYREIFLDRARIEQGAAFWRRHAETLERAERVYGVSPAVIVAILGVETRYGSHRGSYRVLDALATLAFDYPPRAEFFRRELESFLLLAREEGRPLTEPLGSYAGAMGYGQFMPSSYRAYAVDFDGDGRRDIWENPVDAVGSVAHYLARHGWERAGEIARRVNVSGARIEGLIDTGLKPELRVGTLRERGVRGLEGLPPEAAATLMALEARGGEEHWLGLENFYVITRYNHSRLYGMAVRDLATAVRAHREGRVAGGDEGQDGGRDAREGPGAGA